MCLGELTYLKGLWENVQYSVKKSLCPSIVPNNIFIWYYESNRVPFFNGRGNSFWYNVLSWEWYIRKIFFLFCQVCYSHSHFKDTYSSILLEYCGFYFLIIFHKITQIPQKLSITTEILQHPHVNEQGHTCTQHKHATFFLVFDIVVSISDNTHFGGTLIHTY